MVKWLPRLGRKKTGDVSISDGKFKIEVKERFRIFGIFTIAFAVLIAICLFVFPYVVAGLALVWMIGTVLLSGLFDMLNYARIQAWNRLKWVSRWGIKQPFLDFKYGRKKRKELEDTRTYAQ